MRKAHGEEQNQKGNSSRLNVPPKILTRRLLTRQQLAVLRIFRQQPWSTITIKPLGTMRQVKQRDCNAGATTHVLATHAQQTHTSERMRVAE